jgi:hypothetical protein
MQRTNGSGGVLIWALALFVSGAVVRGQAAPPDPHKHVVPVHERPWSIEDARRVSLVRVRDRLRGEDTVVSPGKQWRAFVVIPKDEAGGRVRIELVRSGEMYEIRGVPLPYRPISSLEWITDRYLTFDRWSQPHYGLYYLLDVPRRRVVLARAFPDSAAIRSTSR